MVEWHGDDIEDENTIEPEEGGDDAVAKVKKLKQEIAELRKEKQEYMDGWQRAKADYVNALKRFDEEKAAASERGVEKALAALLPAIDALERAKLHGELPSGFEAIVKQLESAFAKLDVHPVGEVGEQFNPELHEALGQDAAETTETDGTVSAVLERGWKRGERVIKPAKVRVAHAV
jgi:molecular chaperone GrpE